MTERRNIDRLIINSPYDEPQRYWRYNRERRTFTLVEGERRPAGYVIASESSASFDDPGVFAQCAHSKRDSLRWSKY
jgi:type III restriction enzyme